MSDMLLRLTVNIVKLKQSDIIHSIDVKFISLKEPKMYVRV